MDSILQETLKSLIPKQEELPLIDTALCLTNLHQDCLVLIAQYLTICELSKFEQCNRFYSK